MAGTVSGALLGWITRSLKEQDSSLSFRTIANAISGEDEIEMVNNLKNKLVDEYGLDPNSEAVKNLKYDNGKWYTDHDEYEDEDDDADLEEVIEIEDYGVPDGTWVKIGVIKAWVKANISNFTEIERDSWLCKRGFYANPDELEYGGGKKQASLIKNISYAIQKSWYEYGFKSKAEKVRDSDGNEYWRNKYTGKEMSPEYAKARGLI